MFQCLMCATDARSLVVEKERSRAEEFVLCSLKVFLSTKLTILAISNERLKGSSSYRLKFKSFAIGIQLCS